MRNGELHTADAVLANTPAEVWLPKFLDVVEAVCAHLDIPLGDILASEVVDQARAYRDTVDQVIRRTVEQAVRDSKYLFDRLTADEISRREASRDSRMTWSAGRHREVRRCPSCGMHTAILVLGAGRTQESIYKQDTDEIESKVVFLAQSLSCRVCGLELSSTAELMAAGFDRLNAVTFTEDRYEGWEERMTYEDALNYLGAGEDYGNE